MTAMLILFSSLFIWITYALINNTLNKNGNWDVTKTQLAIMGGGDFEFLNSHPTLAFNRLNLSAWLGFQEVILKEKFPIYTIDFDFYLSENSYFYFIFNKKIDNFSAIRLSANPSLTNLNLIIKNTGEFESKSSLDISELQANKWHHAQFVFIPNSNAINFSLNHGNNISISANFELSQKVGFRSSYKPIFIDNVVIKNSLYNIVFNDNFSYRDRAFIKYFLSILLSICLLNVLLSITIHQLKKKRNNTIKIIYVLNITFLGLTALITYLLYFWLLNTYPKPNTILNTLIYKIGYQNKTEYIDWAEKYAEELFNKYHSSNRKKILFIGSSQTFGAGVNYENETYVRVTEAKINQTNDIYQIINCGINGLTSNKSLEFYQKYWIGLNPTIVVIDLSSNDRDFYNTPDILKASLTTFAQLNKKKGITTIFILEPNSYESINSNEFIPFHNAMKSVGLDYNILTLDPHTYLEEKKNTGIIWWDQTHPTSYGHQLIGEFIYDAIKDIL